MKFRFENLNVYKDALEFVKLINIATKAWPKEEQFGLVSQIRRASNSVLLNIAEGSSRTQKDFQHFLSLSRGSCYECVAVLQIAKELGYLKNSDYKNLYEKVFIIAKMLSSLRTSLGNSK